MIMQNNQDKSITCIVDTDILIDYIRQRDYSRKLLAFWSRGGLIAVSSLTHLELYRGIRDNEEEATKALLDGLSSISVDVSIAQKAGRMLWLLRSRGITIGIKDAVIEATDLEVGVPL